MVVTVPVEMDEREYSLLQLLADSEGLTPPELLATLLVEQTFSDRRFVRAVVRILRVRQETIQQVSTAGAVPLLTVFAALLAYLGTLRSTFETEYLVDPSAATTVLSDAAFLFLDNLLSEGGL